MTYPPHNPDDEPRSEPFRPMSYDLAPEYGTPPPVNNPGYPPVDQPGPYQQPSPYQDPYQQPGQYQDPYQQPVYQDPGYQTQTGYPVSAQPGYQQPVSAQPAYQQPVYQDPGYQQPVVPQVVAPPPPPPKKRGALKAVLFSVGGVLVLCLVATCVFFYPILSESAHVTAPPTLPGGLTKDTSDSSDKLTNSAETSLRKDIGNLDEIATGVYTADGDATKLVVLIAATGTFTFPDDEVDKAFKGFNDGASGSKASIGVPKSYDAGNFGGTVKCADGSAGGTGGYAMCVWADHGDIGVVLFIGRSSSEVAGQFVQIRESVQSR